jgi:hypothetical protein
MRSDPGVLETGVTLGHIRPCQALVKAIMVINNGVTNRSPTTSGLKYLTYLVKLMTKRNQKGATVVLPR